MMNRHLLRPIALLKRLNYDFRRNDFREGNPVEFSSSLGTDSLHISDETLGSWLSCQLRSLARNRKLARKELRNRKLALHRRLARSSRCGGS